MLNFPKDERADNLLRRMDEGYFAFVRSLPSPLQALAMTRSTYTGRPDSRAFEGPSQMNSALACAPWLFWETFSSLDDELFLSIATAGAFFATASLLLDHIIDRQVASVGATALLHQALYGRGVALFRQTLPPSSEFWPSFERLAAEHLAGLAVELEAQSNPQVLNLERFRILAHSKGAPIIATIAALAVASGQSGLLKPIETSIKHLAFSSQLIDDIGDLLQDLNARHVTYYMTTLIPPEKWQAREWPSAEELMPRIEVDWADVTHLRSVIEGLEQSIQAVGGLECPAWIEYVAGYERLAGLQQSKAIAMHLRDVLRPLALGTSG